MFSVRALWEGQVLESYDFGDMQASAEAMFSSAVSLYRRQDIIDGGITVQLLNGDDVEYETFVDGN